MTDELLQPVKYYDDIFKNRVKEEAEKFFDELTDKARTDVVANRKTINDIAVNENALKNIKKTIKKRRVGKILLIILMIALILGGLLLLVLAAESHGEKVPLWVGIVSSIVGVAGFIGILILIINVINPRLNEAKALRDKLEGEHDALVNLARSQVSSLWANYDYNMHIKVFNNASELVDIDEYFQPKKLTKLINHCDYEPFYGEGNNVSTTYIASGDIFGNPFVIRRYKVQEWVDVTYHGELQISYRVTRHGSDGKTYTETVTETLRATYTAPAPSYYTSTALIYGNDAAPDLHFVRKENNMSHETNEKKLDKYIRKEEDEQQKMGQQDIAKGRKHVFTPIGNPKFEALFHAYNRDHEQQFRLLFTPLAQQNIINLLTDHNEEHFGDDFVFQKSGRTNMISSTHSQAADLTLFPESFMNISYDTCRQWFVDACCKYAKNIFFDFAPLLCIPLYQQHKSLDYIYGEDIASNFTEHEDEMFSNLIDPDQFKPDDCKTELILRAHTIKSKDKSDKAEVTAYGFSENDRVAYVSVKGGDGYRYDVPVHWIEYLPVQSTRYVELQKVSKSRFDFVKELNNNNLREKLLNACNAFSFKNGVMTTVSESINFLDRSDEAVDKLFG